MYTYIYNYIYIYMSDFFLLTSLAVGSSFDHKELVWQSASLHLYGAQHIDSPDGDGPDPHGTATICLGGWHACLVGGLEHFFTFSGYLGYNWYIIRVFNYLGYWHHPNWRTHIFSEGQVETTKQVLIFQHCVGMAGSTKMGVALCRWQCLAAAAS